jgi:uncharacterized protein YegJ (DUF2314 family)
MSEALFWVAVVLFTGAMIYGLVRHEPTLDDPDP